MAKADLMPGNGATPMPETVLLVEDEALIAFEAESLLHDLGVRDVTMCANYDQAEREVSGLNGEQLPLAIFDINLNGRLSTPLIERYADMGGRVVIATGYELEESFVDRLGAVHLVKPYDLRRLGRAIVEAQSRAQPEGGARARPNDAD